MSTAYFGKWSCCNVAGVNASHIKPWMEDVLRKWHKQDPPTDLEMTLNNDVYAIQKNRSPFIDHPEWVDKIPDF